MQLVCVFAQDELQTSTANRNFHYRDLGHSPRAAVVRCSVNNAANLVLCVVGQAMAPLRDRLETKTHVQETIVAIHGLKEVKQC
jgi:hypothetical protein